MFGYYLIAQFGCDNSAELRFQNKRQFEKKTSSIYLTLVAEVKRKRLA